VTQRRRYTGNDRQWEQWKVTDSKLDNDQKAMLLAVVDAAHDIIDGKTDVSEFVELARNAMIQGNSSVWQGASNWITKIGRRIPEVTVVWTELVSHANWKVRWRVACCLYSWGIEEKQSDRLFATLRNDKSEKVRRYAVDRYEARPNEKREVVTMFDANQFDDRVRRGEVMI
jgi:hypothetical protein